MSRLSPLYLPGQSGRRPRSAGAAARLALGFSQAGSRAEFYNSPGRIDASAPGVKSSPARTWPTAAARPPWNPRRWRRVSTPPADRSGQDYPKQKVRRKIIELFWEPLKQGLVAGPFRIVPDAEAYPYFTCILEGPDQLALRCGSIRDAL